MASLMFLQSMLVLGIVILLADAQSSRPGWMRRKAECPPSFKVNVRLRSDGKDNFLRGPCKIRGAGRDTCRRRMSCCENSQKELLCIRARVFKPKFEQQKPIETPDFPSIPPIAEAIMQNDVESLVCPKPLRPVIFPGGAAQPCPGYGKFAIPCKSNFDCSGDRICCRDPCPGNPSPLMLCLRPVNFDFPSQNFPKDNFAQDSTGSNFLEDSKPDNAGFLLAPPPPPVSENAMLSDVEIPNDSCPQPDIQCSPDGKNCAVGCASYAELKECNSNIECDKDRICCKDPCPGTKTKYCFPPTDTKPKIGNLKASPAALVPPPSGMAIQLDDAPVQNKNIVCPAGDLTSCIGWIEDPSKPGTGTCKSELDCAEGLKCCKIAECFDNTRYCVPTVDLTQIPKGCPLPEYAKINKFTKCPRNKSCAGNQRCCQLDLQGTMGCI